MIKVEHQTQLTSIESYRKSQPNINREQKLILALFQNHPTRCFCDHDITEYTGLPINVVTPRRGELADKGCIMKAGTTWYRKTRRKVNVWKLKP